MKRRSLPLIVCVATLTAVPATIAEPIAEDLIAYRKAVMSSIGAHIGAISSMIRRKVDYDHLGTQAKALDLSVSMIVDVFPANSSEGQTDALPGVWENTEDFRAKIATTSEASSAFVAAVEGGDAGDIGRSFGALANSCKGCHDDYKAAN